jgi:hypothetical protein
MTFKHTYAPLCGGWMVVNSTEGVPINISTQVFDIKGNSTNG